MMCVRRGQTLIELLIAMAVILVGLVAAGMLVISNVRMEEVSAERIMGTNFAREGVELAKAVRDSNWLHGDPFITGLVGPGNDHTAVPVFTLGAFDRFDFTPDDIDTDAAQTTMIISNQFPTVGLFLQGGVSGDPMPYRRLVTFYPICGDGSVIMSPVTCTVAQGGTVGVRVISKVVWDLRGVRRQSVIVDDLYDWR